MRDFTDIVHSTTGELRQIRAQISGIGIFLGRLHPPGVWIDGPLVLAEFDVQDGCGVLRAALHAFRASEFYVLGLPTFDEQANGEQSSR